MIARGRRWLRRTALALVLLAVPRIAHAQARVVVTVTAATPETSRAIRMRVAPELALRGFTVVHAEHDRLHTDPVDELLARARDEDAQLGVLVRVDTDGSVRIDVVDRITGKRLERSTSMLAAHGISETALAAAELVDASLVELRLAHRSAVGEVAPPRGLPIPEPRSRHARWQADGAVLVLWPLRMRAPIGLAAVAIGIRPTARLGLALEGTVPLFAFQRATPIATLRTFPFLLALRADLGLLRPTSTLRLDLQAALAAMAVRIDVDAIAGARGHPQTVWSSAATLGLVLHKPVGHHAALGVTARAVIPFEDLRVAVDGHEVQHFGAIWLGAGLGVLARW